MSYHTYKPSCLTLLNLLHLLHNLAEYAAKEIQKDATDAIRKNILSSVKSEEEGDQFGHSRTGKEAAPCLFREGFEKKMKDRTESQIGMRLISFSFYYALIPPHYLFFF